MKNKVLAILEHVARRAKAYTALAGSALTGVISSGLVLPSPYDHYVAAAAAVATAVGTFQVPNRQSAIDADVAAAKDAYDAIAAVGNPRENANG